MTLQNRVSPSSEIFKTSARGTLMGNRGILHDGERTVVKRWAHQAWIHCVLEFKGRKRTLMSPGRYTELFFLDEVTALAAGHRPCGECQRDKYRVFKGLMELVYGRALKSAEMDKILHNERRIPYKRSGWKRTFSAELSSLPDYVMITQGNEPYLKLSSSLLRWTASGYVDDGISAESTVTVLTPQSIVEVLRLGYVPGMHDSAKQDLK